MGCRDRDRSHRDRQPDDRRADEGDEPRRPLGELRVNPGEREVHRDRAAVPQATHRGDGGGDLVAGHVGLDTPGAVADGLEGPGDGLRCGLLPDRDRRVVEVGRGERFELLVTGAELQALAGVEASPVPRGGRQDQARVQHVGRADESRSLHERVGDLAAVVGREVGRRGHDRRLDDAGVPVRVLGQQERAEAGHEGAGHRGAGQRVVVVAAVGARRDRGDDSDTRGDDVRLEELVGR